MRRSPLLVRGGFAALSLTGLALAGCSASGTHHTAATTTPPASTSTAPAPAPVPAGAGSVTVRDRITPLGNLLTTSGGLTLYTFALDRNGISACTGGCATAWPPLTVPTGATPTSAVPLTGRLGTIARPGARQATYNGRPLYRFAADSAPGQTRGQGIKGVWFVVKITGAATPMPATPAPTRTSHTPPTSSASPTSCIPQGGAGDGDGDNSGGPSDGDGCA